MKTMTRTVSKLFDKATRPTKRFFKLLFTEGIDTQSSNRYRDFVEKASDGFAEFSLAGECIFCNEAAHRLLGYTREEYMQLKYCHRYGSQAIANQNSLIYGEMSRDDISQTIYETQIKKKDGSIATHEIFISAVSDDGGKIVGIRVISRDVTENKRMTEEQATLKKQLMHSQKLEAVGTLASGITHDFNNLLMGIQGYASLLLIDKDIFHADYEKIKAIERIIKSGADLTSRILGYARGSHSSLVPIDMNELIGKTIDMFGHIKKELHIYVKLDPDVNPVEGDRGQMERALLNLLVNASQAMPAGGEIFLESANVTIDGCFARQINIPTGRYVKVSIQDTGTGMDEWTKHRIFEPFFSTKGAGRGTGLGLTTVYNIISGHKGTIQVSSSKGHGSTFSIYLPAAAKKTFKNHERSSCELMHGHETILLADDEQVIRDVTGNLLTTLGYKVLIARNGEEAVKIFEAQHQEIMVVILDMIMPDMGGDVVFDKIKTIHPDVRVILSSGFHLNGKAEAIMRRGCQAFLQKPYRFEELSRTVRCLIDIQIPELEHAG